MGHIYPVASEDVSDLQFQLLPDGKNIPTTSEPAVFRVVRNGAVRTGLKFVEIGLCELFSSSSSLPRRFAVRSGCV